MKRISISGGGAEATLFCDLCVPRRPVQHVQPILRVTPVVDPIQPQYVYNVT